MAQDAFSNFDPLRAIERLFFTNLRPGQAHLSLLTHAGISFYSGRAKKRPASFYVPRRKTVCLGGAMLVPRLAADARVRAKNEVRPLCLPQRDDCWFCRFRWTLAD